MGANAWRLWNNRLRSQDLTQQGLGPCARALVQSVQSSALVDDLFMSHVKMSVRIGTVSSRCVLCFNICFYILVVLVLFCWGWHDRTPQTGRLDVQDQGTLKVGFW